jgi:HEAT repeat protein
MATTTHVLIEQLAEVRQRTAAREALVKRGERAAAALLSRLGQPAHPAHRKAMLRTLLALHYLPSVDLFRSALRDADEEVRAIGARGLFLLGTEDALQALVSTLHDDPNPLHIELTPAVESLIELGLAGLSALWPLLNDADPLARQRAQHVLATVTYRLLENQLQPRPLTNVARTAWESLWQQNGNYRWDGPPDQRATSITRWQAWLEQKSGAT